MSNNRPSSPAGLAPVANDGRKEAINNVASARAKAKDETPDQFAGVPGALAGKIGGLGCSWWNQEGTLAFSLPTEMACEKLKERVVAKAAPVVDMQTPRAPSDGGVIYYRTKGGPAAKKVGGTEGPRQGAVSVPAVVKVEARVEPKPKHGFSSKGGCKQKGAAHNAYKQIAELSNELKNVEAQVYAANDVYYKKLDEAAQAIGEAAKIADDPELASKLMPMRPHVVVEQPAPRRELTLDDEDVPDRVINQIDVGNNPAQKVGPRLRFTNYYDVNSWFAKTINLVAGGIGSYIFFKFFKRLDTRGYGRVGSTIGSLLAYGSSALFGSLSVFYSALVRATQVKHFEVLNDDEVVVFTRGHDSQGNAYHDQVMLGMGPRENLNSVGLQGSDIIWRDVIKGLVRTDYYKFSVPWFDHVVIPFVPLVPAVLQPWALGLFNIVSYPFTLANRLVQALTRKELVGPVSHEILSHLATRDLVGIATEREKLLTRMDNRVRTLCVGSDRYHGLSAPSITRNTVGLAVAMVENAAQQTVVTDFL